MGLGLGGKRVGMRPQCSSLVLIFARALPLSMGCYFPGMRLQCLSLVSNRTKSDFGR